MGIQILLTGLTGLGIVFVLAFFWTLQNNRGVYESEATKIALGLLLIGSALAVPIGLLVWIWG